MAIIGGAIAAMGGIGGTIQLVATGVSLVTGLMAANQQSKTESFNRMIAERNMVAQKAAADNQYKMQMAQAGMMAQQANYTAQMQMWDARAQQNMLKQQMDAESRNAHIAEGEGREETRRKREEMMRRMAITNNKLAKAGVVGGVGTPLEILADTAEKLELGVQDAHYQADAKRQKSLLQRSALGFERKLVGLQGKMASNYTRAAGKAQLAIDQFAATSGRMAKNRAADLSWWSVKNKPSQAGAMRMSAIGGAIGGFAGAYGSSSKANYLRKTGGSTYGSTWINQG